MRRPTKEPPTDEQIMAYTNVPIEIAGRYIGWGHSAVRYALREGRAPFGFAAEGENTWYYNVSPGLLVKYKRGELPAYRMEDLQNFAIEGIERLIEVRMEAARRALGGAVA